MSTLVSFLGTKVGMTQLFDENKNIVPVTAIDCGELIVRQIKTKEKDGYNAIQVGKLKKRHASKQLTPAQVASKRSWFLYVKEVRVDTVDAYSVGQVLTVQDLAFQEGGKVAVTGVSRGKGFQGVVKRWGFSGGPKSHGSMFGRLPGSIGNMRRQGEVLKGKKLPGHYGCDVVTVKGLAVIKIDREQGMVFVKGAIPGTKKSLVYMTKQG